MEITAVIIAAVTAFAAVASATVAMFFNVRKMRQDTLKDMVENAEWRTETSRDIRENSQAITRIAESIADYVRRMDGHDRELRAIMEWRIQTESRLEHMAKEISAAFRRSDARKAEIVKLRDDLNGVMKGGG